MKDDKLLTVSRLSAGYGAGDVIRDISFSLSEGEALCIVGESGCGKSTLLKAILGVFELPRVSEGEVRFEGKSLYSLPPKQRHEAATRGMGLIFQSPGAAFNPIRSYKKQFIETLKSHGRYDKESFEDKARQVFEALELRDAERILASCPYEMSGGMNQRIALALCMLMQNRLLLADEPTSALDALSRRTVADELLMLRRETKMAQLIVTHDLALAAYLADRIAVMHEGRIVELADAREIVTAPKHEYTRMLLQSVPTLGED